IVREVTLTPSNSQPIHLALVIFLLISSAGIFCACLISTTADPCVSSRFLINIPYLVVTTAVGCFHLIKVKLKYWEKILYFVIPLLMTLTGLLSAAQNTTSNKLAVNYNRVNEIIDFLQSRHLTYGYGPYHGSLSNAVTWISNFHVKIRPVRFDPQTGWMI